tara:strand:+ start:262 stop:2247 length:1986 start_codon:yes stop_codon:yes gene_type:complete
MATLEQLFAEAGLSVPERNRNRTVTTPGSYEAPVEGIQDYGAFQRGFAAGITPGLIEKKQQDTRIAAAQKEFDAVKLTELIETSDTDPIEFKKNSALRAQTLGLLKGNLRNDYLQAAKRNDTQTMKDIMGQLTTFSGDVANLNNFLTESQKTDLYDIEASNYKIGNNTYTDENGEVKPLTFNELAKVNNTNPEALSYETRKNKYGEVTTFLTVKGSQYGNFEVNLSDLSAANIQNKLAIKADYGKETTGYIKNNPLVDQNTTGAIGEDGTNSITRFEGSGKNRKSVKITGKMITTETDDLNRRNATTFATQTINDGDYEELRASYLVRALKRNDIGDTSLAKGTLAALQSKEGMQKYADDNNLTLDQAKEDVKTNVDKIIQTSLENEYLKRTGSYEFNKETNQYQRAILDPTRSVSDSPETKTKGSGSGSGSGLGGDDFGGRFKDFVQTSNKAENYLKSRGIGSKLTKRFAPKMADFLKNKTIGGSSNFITDFKYEFVGYQGNDDVGNKVITSQEDYDKLSDDEKANYKPKVEMQIFYNKGEKTDSITIDDINRTEQIESVLNKIDEGEFGTGTTAKTEIRENQAVQQLDIDGIQKLYGVGEYTRSLEAKTNEALKGIDEIDIDGIRRYVYSSGGPAATLRNSQKEKLINYLKAVKKTRQN